MKRRKTGSAREARKLADAGIKLLALGGAFVVLPMLLSKSPVGKALDSLSTLGWLMLAAGALLMFLGGRLGKPRIEAEPVVARNPEVFPRRAPTASEHDPFVGPLAADDNLPPPRPALQRPSAWGKSVFDVIEWRRFEAVVERLFQQAGFETRSQSHGADEGVDVWLYSRHQPGDPVSLVQCKHWQGKRVGVDKIRELRGVMAARNVKRGQFATTSTFTPVATAFASENGINLLDVAGLLTLISQRSPEERAALLQIALEGDYWRPTCVNCGVKMVDRVPRKGGSAFWGCTNFPKCKATMLMRAA